ncbi:MAG: ferredoxin family protein [Tannerella sp.]|nr:ferredoxin family protein [Tannerella sp.]
MEADLCETALDAPLQMSEIASSTVMACYPRAVAALFDRLQLSPAALLNLRCNSAEQLLSGFSLAAAGQTEAHVPSEWDALPQKPGCDAWYPVIDKHRCSECGQCHDYCLFGVYAMADGCVQVVRPRSCKNNCPACARICPNRAVIFPKYEKSPVNGGSEDEEQAVAIDTKALYASALRSRLEQRKAGVSLLKRDPS